MTPFLIHAVVGGAIVGVVVGFAVQPFRRLAARRRARRLAEDARGKIPPGRLAPVKASKFVAVRRWRMKRPRDHGYYSAGRD